MKHNEPVAFAQAAAPGMYYASMVRATDQIGPLKQIHAPTLPQGYSLLTAQELPFKNQLWIGDIAIPVFASQEISYKGEAVGLIVGPDALRVEELAVATTVECEDIAPQSDWHTFRSSNIAARLDYAHNQELKNQESNSNSDTDGYFELKSFWISIPMNFHCKWLGSIG